MPLRIVVGVTGASGAVYARGLLTGLSEAGADVHLIVSPLGRAVAASELGGEGKLVPSISPPARLTRYRHDDLFGAISSGSYKTDGMVICPCSCHTLACIASGLGDNLISRAAHVHLKERRRLLLCVREMPLTQIDLQNMVTVSQAGGVICPASPAFYGGTVTLDTLINSVVGRLLDLLGIPNELAPRWTGPQGGPVQTPDDGA
jgi:4-hydroxy-3-polyprenylbenzoate decarboxylase